MIPSFQPSSTSPNNLSLKTLFMDPKDGSSSSNEDEISRATEGFMFAQMHEVLGEIEKKRKEKELAPWLAEWKMLTDAGEAWLKELGYTDETVFIECFEEIMPGEEVASDVEVVHLPDEETEEEDDDNNVDRGGVYGGGGGYEGGVCDGGVGGSGGSG